MKSLFNDENGFVVSAELILVATIVVLGFYLVTSDNYGGWTAGLRWLMWLTPLWLLTMLPVIEWLGERFRVAIDRNTAEEFYIEGVDHRFVKHPSGAAHGSTTLSLTRGWRLKTPGDDYRGAVLAWLDEGDRDTIASRPACFLLIMLNR